MKHTGPLIEACWQSHYGVICRGVNWNRFSLQQVLEIAECVGGVGLSVVLRLMAEDHAGSLGGWVGGLFAIAVEGLWIWVGRWVCDSPFVCTVILVTTHNLAIT